MINFFRFLERFERTKPGTFWLSISFMGLSFYCLNSSVLNDQSYLFPTNQTNQPVQGCLAKNQALEIWGGGNNLNPLNLLKKRKNFDLLFHIALEREFPDWSERVNYEKNQQKFLASVIAKQKELKRLRIKDDYKFYTEQELDSIHYFQGTGFYQKKQDQDVEPNVYDTRKSFLLKMHNPKARDKFLKSFNDRN